jgi:3',5'-cyclic AMP phosphodiesterase CpdA
VLQSAAVGPKIDGVWKKNKGSFMHLTLMHISDLHAGPPFNPDKADLIVREAEELNPDLMVLSGDMVQRADFTRQWLEIREFIKRLPEPRLIVPGNHDVPMFNQIARFLWPFKRFQKYITPNLQPIVECDGLVAIGVATPRSFTIENGKLDRQKIAWLEQTLKQYGNDVCKVVVMHHHVVQPPGPPNHRKDVIVGAEETLAALDRGGAELVLCGHVHTSYVGNTLEFDPTLRQGTIIAQSGTSTSRRGRLWHRGKNSFNVIEVEDQVIRISQRMFLEDAARFVPVSEHVFPRRSGGAYFLPRQERVLDASRTAQPIMLEQ